MAIIKAINMVGIVFACTFLFISDLQAAQQTSRITGYVVYGEVRDKPLNGIDVTVTEAGKSSGRKKTNANGYYTTEKLSPGTYEVTIDHPDYNPADATVRLTIPIICVFRTRNRETRPSVFPSALASDRDQHLS